jgi:hypothetical protein
MVFLMVKPQLCQLKRQQLEKTCFGTKEWSKNSGICNGCEKKDDCGKIKARKDNL